MNGTPTSPSTQPGPAPISPELVQGPGALALLPIFLGATSWLLLSSVFGLVASIKFHSPDFLANSAWLTYGRVYAAHSNCLLYGFALQAGLGIALWLMTQLGQVALPRPLFAVAGAAFFNLGVLVGTIGILGGDSTGFENLELPGYATPILFIGYLLMTVPALLSFHGRNVRLLFVSQWFVLAALLWFPWIFATAQLLLISYPVRGMTQAVIAWWYSQNLVDVWLTLIALATVFYLLPTTERPLRGRYLALFAFWVLILFTSWAGIPSSAPVPAWLPTLSTAARVLTLTLLIAVALIVYGTLGRFALVMPGSPPLSFALFGVGSFLLAGMLPVAASLWDPSQLLQFTWISPARSELQIYGFFAMTAFGLVYYAVPRLFGAEFRWRGLVRLHFWVAATGVVLIVLPLIVGGLIQFGRIQNPSVPFVDVARSALPFLRIATLGELLLLLGHFFLLLNLSDIGWRLARKGFLGTYAIATTDLFKPAGAKA